jgi:peroxiredoxin Q/BCP
MSQAIGIRVGAQAPDFTLKDAEGATWRLSDKCGRVVVLLFYPADNTSVCTKQMCSVRDRWTDYTATGALVVGISTDSEDSHKEFAAQHNLPLRLLADTTGEVVKLYKAGSLLPGKAARFVIVIDGKGIVRYRKINPIFGSLVAPNDEDILAAIRAAQTNAM